MKAESDKPCIVLLRGMLGFSNIPGWDYFHGAGRMLEAQGFTVLVPALPWGKSNVDRADFLAQALESASGPLHLVAHSMGGVDARRYITHLGGHGKVASLTTISSPHRGSMLADDAMASLLSPWRHIPAVRDLTLPAMQRFNEATPDMPEVIYRSYSAARKLDEQPWLMRSFGRRLQACEGDNDNQVAASSALWGEHCRHPARRSFRTHRQQFLAQPVQASLAVRPSGSVPRHRGVDSRLRGCMTERRFCLRLPLL